MSITRKYTQLVISGLCLLIFFTGCAQKTDFNKTVAEGALPSQTIESIEFDQGQHISYSINKGMLAEERFSDIYGKVVYRFDTLPVDNLLGFQVRENAKHRVYFQAADGRNCTVVSTEKMTCLYHEGFSSEQNDSRMNQVCLEHATDQIQANFYSSTYGENLPSSIMNNVDDTTSWSLLQDFRIDIKTAFEKASRFITQQQLGKYVERELRKTLGHETLAQALYNAPIPLLDDQKSDIIITLFEKENSSTTIMSVRAESLSLVALYRNDKSEFKSIMGYWEGKYKTLGFKYYYFAPDNQSLVLFDGTTLGASNTISANVNHDREPLLTDSRASESLQYHSSHALFPDVHGKLSKQSFCDLPDCVWLSAVGMSQIYQEKLRGIVLSTSIGKDFINTDSPGITSLKNRSVKISVLPFEKLNQKEVQKHYKVPYQLYQKARTMMNESVI